LEGSIVETVVAEKLSLRKLRRQEV
jgi:hypothetical protein